MTMSCATACLQAVLFRSGGSTRLDKPFDRLTALSEVEGPAVARPVVAIRVSDLLVKVGPVW